MVFPLLPATGLDPSDTAAPNPQPATGAAPAEQLLVKPHQLPLLPAAERGVGVQQRRRAERAEVGEGQQEVGLAEVDWLWIGGQCCGRLVKPAAVRFRQCC